MKKGLRDVLFWGDIGFQRTMTTFTVNLVNLINLIRSIQSRKIRKSQPERLRVFLMNETWRIPQDGPSGCNVHFVEVPACSKLSKNPADPLGAKTSGHLEEAEDLRSRHLGGIRWCSNLNGYSNDFCYFCCCRFNVPWSILKLDSLGFFFTSGKSHHKPFTLTSLACLHRFACNFSIILDDSVQIHTGTRVWSVITTAKCAIGAIQCKEKQYIDKRVQKIRLIWLPASTCPKGWVWWPSARQRWEQSLTSKKDAASLKKCEKQECRNVL